MWADVERLGLRMVAEVERHQCGARLTSQQESDGGRARRVALQSFSDGAAQCSSAILFQQLRQLSCLGAGRFALREGQVQQRLALRHGLLQTASGCGVERLPLDLEYRILMAVIEHELLSSISTYLPSDLDRPIHYAHAAIGS